MAIVSIIVPVYNGEKYLKRCVESLINQTYKDIEIIFINDGSNDNSLKILNKYKKLDKRIIVITKKNTGVSDTRNLGIRNAKGEYICFCDCDDMYEENYIEVMYRTIREKNVDVVRCNYKVVDKNDKYISKGNLDKVTDKVFDKYYKNNKIIPMCLKGSIPCFSYLLIIKKSKIDTWYPVDVAMMEDVVFYIRLLANVNSLYIIDDCLYTIMFNEVGATNSVGNYKRNILNVLKVNNYLKEELNSNNISNEDNFQCINVNNLNAISDFIFKYYLYGNDDIIKFCKEIRVNDLLKIILDTDLNKINIQRRIILKLLFYEKYRLLKIYFRLRKIIFKIRRLFV